MTIIAPAITSNPQTIAGGTYANLASLINTRVWRLVVTPTLGSVAFTGGLFHVLFGQANGGLSFVNATLQMDDSPSDATMFSQALTWSAGQVLTFTIDTRAATRSVTIAGATTGNGTFTYASGNAIVAAGTNLEIGGVGGSSTFAGTIAGFDDTSPEMSWSPHMPPLPSRRPASVALLAAALAAPPFIPVVPAPPLSWAPSFPDFVPRPRGPVLTGGAAAPTTAIPDPAAPPVSWLPSFPDSVPRARAAPLTSGAVAPVATIPNTDSPPLAWAPNFPAALPRARAAPLAAGMVAPVAVIPDPPAPPVSWMPGFPDRIVPRRGAPLAAGAVAPVRVISDVPAIPILGVTAWREKANTTTPNTGTVTTLAAYPAWPASTAESMITDPRVTNAGNVYELATSGTTASSGGPTGTPAPVTNGAITDNGAKWNYLVTGSGVVDTQASGSLFLVSTGQGSDANSGTTPTDNKGNTYTKIGSTSFFAGFPQSSAASFVAGLPSTGGAAHTVSGTYGLGLDGGGDEKSLMFVEIIGGTSIIDHSQGEFSPDGSNVVTSAPVTTTGPATLVCFCWLNGVVHADGFLHTATPGSGFSLLALASGLLEIGNTAGQVQGCTISRQVATSGTYTASITTGAGLSEGAVMHLIAIQGSAVDPPSAASWLPRLPDFAPRARPPVNMGGLAEPVAVIPDAPPLSWSPRFPDRIVRPPAPPIAGGSAALLATIPDAPPLSWDSTFPDVIARARAAPLAAGSSAPVLAIPDTGVPALSWASAFPDFAPRARAAVITGGAAAPTAAIPDPAAPPTSWLPIFPDATPRVRGAPLAAGQAAPVAVLPDQQPTIASWLPVLPPIPPARARAAPLASGGTPPTLTLPDPVPLSWAPSFPDAVRPRVLAPAGGLVAPVQAIPNPAAPPMSWAPSFPDAIRRAPAAPIVGGAASPVATLPDPPAPALSWSPRFPDHVLRARGAPLAAGGVGPAAQIAARVLVRLTATLETTGQLAATIGTNGQLAGTLQLQGATVADIVGPITVYQGDTASFLLTVLKDDGTPFDLTLATAIDVRVKPADGGADPPSIALGLGAGVNVLTDTSKATIAFGTADTSIPVLRYRINVVVTAPGLRQHVVAPRDFVIAAVD